MSPAFGRGFLAGGSVFAARMISSGDGKGRFWAAGAANGAGFEGFVSVGVSTFSTVCVSWSAYVDNART